MQIRTLSSSIRPEAEDRAAQAKLGTSLRPKRLVGRTGFQISTRNVSVHQNHHKLVYAYVLRLLLLLGIWRHPRPGKLSPHSHQGLFYGVLLLRCPYRAIEHGAFGFPLGPLRGTVGKARMDCGLMEIITECTVKSYYYQLRVCK